MHSITPAHRDLFQQCTAALGEWRSFVIGVDGHLNNGKSTIARFLAWQLEMPCIETDLFITGAINEHDTFSLRVQMAMRLDENRPVIVEGACLLNTLAKVRIEPDFLIYARNTDSEPDYSPGLAAILSEYEAKFEPLKRADYLFEWSEETQ